MAEMKKKGSKELGKTQYGKERKRRSEVKNTERICLWKGGDEKLESRKRKMEGEVRGM